MTIIIARIDEDFLKLSENINIASVLSENYGKKKPRFFPKFWGDLNFSNDISQIFYMKTFFLILTKVESFAILLTLVALLEIKL